MRRAHRRRRRGVTRRTLEPLSRAALSAVVAFASELLAACGGGGDAELDVRDAWARPTAAGADVAAVYFTVRADGGDALIGVDVPADVADGASIHSTESVGGQLSMKAVAVVPLADDDVVFEPGGLHVMLTELARPLAEGATFELTLTFDRAEPATVTVEVSNNR